MTFQVKKAERKRRPLKIALEGLSGSGKTFTALRLAFALKRAGVGKRIVVADSENESVSLYAGVRQDGEVWDYEVCPIPPDKQNPAGYAELYEYLVAAGYDLIVIDSMSHAWHGAMEQVDATARKNRGDKFAAWADVTPAQRRMVALLTDPRAHLIATMRVKSEYERVAGENGKDRIKKVGLKTDQREGTEYEFDAVVRLDSGHEAHVEKVRGCTAMDGATGTCPGPEFWKKLIDWWLSAEPEPDPLAPHRAACAAAGTPDALKAAWEATPGQHRAALLADKDRRKAELAAAAPGPVEPPAAADTTGERLQGLLLMVAKAGLTWPKAREEFREHLTLKGSLAVPDVITDLSPAQVEVLKSKLAERIAAGAGKAGGP